MWICHDFLEISTKEEAMAGAILYTGKRRPWWELKYYKLSFNFWGDNTMRERTKERACS
jgi:hypothetical protein